MPPTRDVYNRLFEIEFDSEPLPNQAAAKGAMKDCNASNMEYLRSVLPSISSAMYDHRQFFKQMAKRQWRVVAGPSAQAQAAGLRGVVGRAGSHRAATVTPTMWANSRPLLGAHYRATDWDKIQGLDRVNAYAFRGEKRTPHIIRAAGGFKPGSMRTDDFFVKLVASRFSDYMRGRFRTTIDEAEVQNYIKGQGGSGRIFVEYEIWRAIYQGEELHVGKMVKNEFLKGYISTSRDVSVAYNFFRDPSQGGKDANGAVYALHTEGGFLLPEYASKHAHRANQGEAEIAHPGPLPWSKVVAFRPYNKRDFRDESTWEQPDTIYMRKGWVEKDPQGYRNVFNALGSLD